MKIFRRWLATCLFMVAILGMATVANAKDITNHLAPDYSQDSSWSVVTKDPARSFDVFFIHPTTYGKAEYGLNAPIDKIEIRKGTDASVQTQASAFKKSCNIYAPRYRQVSMEVLGMETEKREPYLTVAENDILRAFNYYLEHFNNGRPYILASHSQGSVVALRLLKKHKGLAKKDQMVAAYLIGWTFTDNDLKESGLPLAVAPEQTGALITWNTIGKGGNSPTLLPGANCVNPLTWTASRENAPASLNLGAVIDLDDGTVRKIKNFTSARINEAGGLEIPTPSIVDQLDMKMGPEVYHRYDYAFFYENIVENAKARCKAWAEKK